MIPSRVIRDSNTDGRPPLVSRLQVDQKGGKRSFVCNNGSYSAVTGRRDHHQNVYEQLRHISCTFGHRKFSLDAFPALQSVRFVSGSSRVASHATLLSPDIVFRSKIDYLVKLFCGTCREFKTLAKLNPRHLLVEVHFQCYPKDGVQVESPRKRVSKALPQTESSAD
jgi:hypothetical protein